MKVKHTQSNSANRQFDKSQTGFLNSKERKLFNQMMFSEDKTHKGFGKPKPIRAKKIRTHQKKNNRNV